MYYGQLEGALLKEPATIKVIKEMLTHWSRDDRHYRVTPDAETYHEIAHRSREALETLLRTHSPTHMVIVAHARLTKILISDLLSYGPSMMSRIPHDNCGVSVIDVSKTEPFLYKKVIFNITAHL
eukprot:TRINITY_DN18169_c0_g1_i1.p1 TRINITY_DN18169_c0_g1~~TRINITY_DN18169_c0_g1_i1.p1  ORF type:complete len:135 (+),score=13.03 TRINITY_DN18169_c0_g1_i1:31-405(+)